MSLSIKKFSLPKPVRNVVLLPDACFFVRSVPIPEGTLPAEVAGICELALESLAPFPLAQLYYGHHWLAGSPHALVFAAYRKRFTAEQTETWADAEAVLPTFAALLAAPMPRAGTMLLTTADGITALYWENTAHVPTQVIYRSIPTGANEDELNQIRIALHRELGGTREEIELKDAPILDADAADHDFVFRSGKIVSGFSREAIDAIDVRDKDELASRRRARARDLMLWRAFAASLILLLCGIGAEMLLVGGKIWQSGRVRFAQARAEGVEKIESAFNLAGRIDELSNKRMLPFEMITIADSVRPDPIVFDRVVVEGLNVLVISAHAATSEYTAGYEQALNALPHCTAEVKNKSSGGGRVNLEIRIEFKPEFMTQTEQSS